MATSVGFESSDHHQNAKQRTGIRKSKSNEAAQKKKKKQPQRGMGVAQLERLRLQERWKRMTDQNPPPFHHDQSLNKYYSVSTSFPDPTSFSKFGYGAMGSNPGLLFQMLGGFSGFGFGGGVFSSQFHVDPFGLFGAPSPTLGVGVGNVGETETSRELSSMPNMCCYSYHCGLCNKKKRFNCENLGCGFLGFNIGNKQNIEGENQDFGTMRAPSQELVEVVAVHKKGTSGDGSSLLMEYEFFPAEKDVIGTTSEELDLDSFSEASVAMVGGTTTGFDASPNSVDLSLKLSY